MSRRVLGWFVVVGCAGGLAEFLGTYWDVWWHVRFRRESLLSPPHLTMLSGMVTLLLLGLLALRLARGEGPGQRRLGLLLALVGGSQILALGFDEGWHRLFGQDAFVLSPPHILLIAGFTASMACLAAVAAHLAAEQPAWQAGVVAAGALTLAALLLLIAEGSFPAARTWTEFLERHRTQTHPHVGAWLAILAAPPLAASVWGFLARLGGYGRRGALLVGGAAALYTVIGALPAWILPAGRGSPAPPLLLLAGALLLAAGLASAGDGRRPPYLAYLLVLMGPAVWLFEWTYRTHYAWAVSYNQGWWYGLSLLACIPLFRAGEAAAAGLLRILSPAPRA